HKVAIDYAKAAGALISFDPNLRFNLWDSQDALKTAVSEFIPMSDILKISDEELEFITGCTDIEDALEDLFNQGVKMVIYTQGADGASAYTRRNRGHASGEKVKAVDTTGAGDSFIGAVLAYMSQNSMDLSNIEDTPSIKLEEMLIFANHYSALSVQRPGAIPSYPKLEEL
ncbi:MAG: carbohydrate kinase, partial [Lachnospiraceae bacterium]|nr:carbohydrate kinase [Lachnospiraceae bacterium]